MNEPYSWVGEPIEKHVELALNLWTNKYKKFYISSLNRVFRFESEPINEDEVVKATIILHDVGKLTSYYQEYIRAKSQGLERFLKGYRHEIIGSAVTFLTFKQKPWRYLASGAVLLHHEPILMGQMLRLGEDYVTLTHAYYSLRVASQDNKVSLDEKGVDILNKILSREGFIERIPESLPIDEMEEAIKECIVRIALRSDKPIMRVKIAALVHILTLLDSLAARSRSDDDGGTFVSQRASLAEVAELCHTTY